MLEIERYISNGRSAAFFRIREHPEIGAKILYHTEGYNAKYFLQKECDIAHFLHRAGISVLNYGDVVQIKIPEHIEETLKKGHKANTLNTLYTVADCKDFFIKRKEEAVWGLIIEYIPDDSIILQINHKHALVSRNRIEYLFNKEMEKVRSLGIDPGNDHKSDSNIIWSESRAKLYLIDFEVWNLKEIKEQKYLEDAGKNKFPKVKRRNFFARLFGV